MEVKEIFDNLEYGPAPESAGIANEWIASHDSKFRLYINGKWENPSSKRYFDVENPSTKEILGKVSQAGSADVDRAVDAASKAFRSWSKLTYHQRAKYLYAIARQVQKHSRLFAVLESMDNGKSIRETRDIDIPLVARHFYHHAGWAQTMDSEMQDHEPLGVVGQIIPWNFPLLMLSWKIAPALAMGNTVVLKPAEQTPMTALLFAEICQQINLPPGVVNIITGAGATGAHIVNHPDIKKIAFTGSTSVGRIIRKATAGTGKKLSLELGGKSPFIVFEDADLDSVVEGIVDAIWFNQGEVCCAGSRLLVQESVSEKLYRKIRRRMQKLRVGNSLDKGIDMGAVVSGVQLKTIEDLVKKGVDEGGDMWQPDWKCPTNGYFFPPTLFTGVSPSDTVSQIEIFGPVLVAMTFRTHAEAVSLANNTRYGLAASIWTENINLALDIAPKVKAGTVWINSTNVFDAASGFGGYKESGFGREGGIEGLYEYAKSVSGKNLPLKPIKRSTTKSTTPGNGMDRTPKLYIGGKQVRPDGGYSINVRNNGHHLGEVGRGNRKDIRNAVEVAHKAQPAWNQMTGHARAQVLYFLAENLQVRSKEFAERLRDQVSLDKKTAEAEVSASVERIYYYAAMADKYDGRVHFTTKRNVTLAMPEAIGVVGIRCPDQFPLLGLISTIIPPVAMGNSVICIPSAEAPLSATDFYQVLDTSDVPGGVINIITGDPEELVETLAKHDDVDGIWQFGPAKESAMIEELSAENMKRTWVNNGTYRDWMNSSYGEGTEFLRRATQVKNIWIPYGA